MDVFYEDTYRVDSRDLDLFGQCRPSAVLGLLQEAATQAACAIHLSGAEVRSKYNAFWMLARIRYELDRPLLWPVGKGGKGGTSPLCLGSGRYGKP